MSLSELSEAPGGPAEAAREDDGHLVVFGYGSLMWSPGFAPDRIHAARVIGWHRRFSMISTTSWGSPARPGLCAALHRGGTSWGRALVVGPDRAVETLEYLDEREAAYLRRPVAVLLRIDGRLVRATALTYVVNPQSPRLRLDLEPEHARRLALRGVGAKGSSYDYVLNAKRALDDDGHVASDVHRFFAMMAR